MAGHSKWSKIKRTKGVLDVRRGKLFSRLAKEISVAVRLGGADAAFNPRLRTAVQAARDQNMPNDNIDRAVKRGSSDNAAEMLEEIVYEGYGPGGAALLIEAATDNRNRTAADLRSIFSKNHGNLAASGSVSYLFHRKGRVAVPISQTSEDQLLEIVLDAGADEINQEDDHFVVLSPPESLYAVAEAVRTAALPVESSALTYLPQTLVTISDEPIAAQVMRLHDALEDCDDVLNVHSNCDIPESVLARLQ